MAVFLATMRWMQRAGMVGALLFAGSLQVQAATPFPAFSADPALVMNAALHEQVVMVPARDNGRIVGLETTIFRPPGEGPFPVLIMNHGKALGSPRLQGRDRFIVISREFVKRGYAVVVPMRKGFSRSGGEYHDAGCDMRLHGQSQADDLHSTLDWLRTQAWADSERVIVAGQSYGGLAALAFGTRPAAGVKGLINFSGGLKVYGGNCSWEKSLVDAFAGFGAKSSLPSLWFYGANDQHFHPGLAARLHRAYVLAGGKARMVAYGPFRKDAHGMAGSRDGVRIWWPETEKFLAGLGMPTEEVHAINDGIAIPETGYAALDDVDAVPYLNASGKHQYRVFLGKASPRAFALSPTGAWSWVEDGDDPAALALAECQKNSSQPCRLYAVDDHVVWDEPLSPTLASTSSPSTAGTLPNP